MKPSSSCSVVLILGIGYGLLTIRLLSSRKSVIVRTVMSFFGILFWVKKTISDRIPEDIFFSLCFQEEFFTGTWFWRGRRNSVFFRFYRNFSHEFLWAGIPVFTQDSSGIRRILENSCSRQKLSGSGQRLKKALC